MKPNRQARAAHRMAVEVADKWGWHGLPWRLQLAAIDALWSEVLGRQLDSEAPNHDHGGRKQRCYSGGPIPESHIATAHTTAPTTGLPVRGAYNRGGS